MDDFPRLVFVMQYLIRTFTRFFSEAGGVIENFFPSFVIGNFVDDENVLRHGPRPRSLSSNLSFVQIICATPKYSANVEEPAQFRIRVLSQHHAHLSPTAAPPAGSTRGWRRPQLRGVFFHCIGRHHKTPASIGRAQGKVHLFRLSLGIDQFYRQLRVV